MLLLNFSHPVTTQQREQIESLTGTAIQEIRTISLHIDASNSLEAQILSVLDAAALTPEQWQTTPLLIVLPGYASAAAMLLTILHGRLGHFPSIVQLSAQYGPVTSYTVTEILNLQSVRERARISRYNPY